MPRLLSGGTRIHLQRNNSVKPSWVDFYAPGSGTEKIDLGNGEVAIDYQFGEMKESDYIKHYKRNQSTSGVEIRINGRLMMSNIFKDIWQLENHPSYNHFLVVINLNSQDRESLPKTRTSKNGIRSGDPKLEKLFEWIRKTHPNPPKDLANAQSERELVKELKDLKDKHIRSKTKHVEMEFKVFNSLNSPVSADLYVSTERMWFSTKQRKTRRTCRTSTNFFCTGMELSKMGKHRQRAS
jgi:hypothetical protein